MYIYMYIYKQYELVPSRFHQLMYSAAQPQHTTHDLKGCQSSTLYEQKHLQGSETSK